MQSATPRRRMLAPAVLGVLILIAGTALPAVADHHNVCDGFAKKNTIRSLGGSNAFSKQGAPTWQDLARQFERHRDEIEAMLAERGLSHVTEQLFEAVKTGKVTERDLRQGEIFQWMAWRRHGKPKATGPLCVATRKTYDAYEVTVRVEKANPPPAISCGFKATGDCREHTLAVSLASASAGATVTMNGTTVVKAGEASWEGPFENRFETDYIFVSSNEAQGTTTVETYTFVIPKVCLNLAFTGKETSEVPGEKVSCSEKATVNRIPAPRVELTAPEEFLAREPFDITATGNGTLTLKITCPNGETVDADSLSSPLSAEAKCRKAGQADVSTTVTTECGDSTTETAAVTVLPNPWWTLRGFAGPLQGDDEVRTAGSRADGTSERTKFQMGNGALLGLGAEYHFNDRVGLEAAVLAGRLDSKFTLDLNNDWATDSQDIDFFAVTVGPNFHLTPDKRVDFYLGPFVGFFNFSDTTYRVLGEQAKVNLDGEFIFGAQAGLDIPFGDSPWGLNLGLRYFALSVQEAGGGRRELDLDPVAGTIGFAYHF